MTLLPAFIELAKSLIAEIVQLHIAFADAHSSLLTPSAGAVVEAIDFVLA